MSESECGVIPTYVRRLYSDEIDAGAGKDYLTLRMAAFFQFYQSRPPLTQHRSFFLPLYL